jgi:NADH-quinone oxidoreductase subunit J
MNFPLSLFYLLSTVIVLSALRVITARNPIHAALFLVLVFFSSAGIWLMLQAEFLAIVLLLVYVGAVMVFFLFVIMMLDIKIDKIRNGFWRYAPLALLVFAVMAIELLLILAQVDFLLLDTTQALPITGSNTEILGEQIYTTYLLPFELAAILLVLAIVAAIMLTMQDRCLADHHVIAVNQQIHINKKDRVRIVNLQQKSAIYDHNKEDESC